jgi:hypothetical protein
MQRPQRESGHVLPVVAALLVVLVGVTALAVDGGALYSSRTAAQEAVDAAALAGAFTFVVNPTAPQPATAVQHALSVATTHRVLGQSINPGDVAIDVSVPNRRVTVNLNYDEDTYFARALGISQVAIGVQGIGEASPNATGSSCAKPWFIPNTAASNLEPCEACAAGQVLVSGSSATGYAQTQLGLRMSVRPTSPENALSPGQFYTVELPGSTGGDDYRTAIGTCWTAPFVCQDNYQVKTGNMVGPTKQGVDALMGPSPDEWVGVGQYRRADSTLTDTSRQLVLAPIWDVCGTPGFCPTGNFPSGSNMTVPTIGFALIFLEGFQGSDVIARLINVAGCDGPLVSNEAAPFGIPVRLVRVPGP